MLSSKCATIYSFFLLITIINLVIEANSNSPESKAHSSLVYRTTNQDNTMNKSYKTFSPTNLNKINNTSRHSFNHSESTLNQTDLLTEMALLKRIRRRISLRTNACSHKNSHQDSHKLVDRCTRGNTSRRNPKFHTHDFNRKDDTPKRQSNMKGKKQDEKSSVLLNSKKLKNATNIALLKDHVKNPGSFTNNPYITGKRIEKVHGVNKTNLNNLSRNYKLNKFGVQGKNNHPFVGRVFNSRESSMNQIKSKNKQRTNIHSSVKRISSSQKQKKEKEHKSFKSDEEKFITSMGETEYKLKKDDSLKLNNNRDLENTSKVTDEERFTGKSHGLLKLKENGLEDKKILTESEKLENSSILFRDQHSKDLKDNLLKTHKNSKQDDRKKNSGNETSLKVRRKAGYLRNNRAILQQVKVHDALSRIRKHSHPKSLKRIARNEKDILYEMKDFIVNNFPKKRDEVVKSSQIHKNVHRETRNANDDNSENNSRMSRNDIPGFKLENKNSKILEEIKDFVVKNFHIRRKKRNPLVQQNLIPLAHSVRSSKDYGNYLSHTAIRSKNNAPGKIESKHFMNTAEGSDSFWGDLQAIVKRKTETNSLSEDVGNFTESEYDDAYDENITKVFTDVHPQIIKKGVNANNSTFETTRQSEEENYKRDSELVSDQYNENLSEITTNEESPTENEGTTTEFSSTEITSDEVSGTEGNFELNTDGKNDSNDQDNVSESSDLSSLPNDSRIPEVTSKHLIEREISTVTNSLSVSSEEALSSLSNTFSEMTDITTLTSSFVTNIFSKSDSTIYENTTPLSTELSSTEFKDITSVDSNTEWNSESSLPSSTYKEGQENSVETSSVSLSTYSTSEESSSVAGIDKVQTSLETRPPKVYRDVQYAKEVEDDYEDKISSDVSTSDTFEEQEDKNTVGWLKRIQTISPLEEHGNKVNNRDKEYKHKLFTFTETTSESMNKFDNTKMSNNHIRKHGGKSQTKQYNYDPERLVSNMNKNVQKSRLNSVKDQKEESLLDAESANEYDEETVSEESIQVLPTTTESSKRESIRFGNIKEGHTNLKAHQKEKSHALSNKPRKFENSAFRSQHDYDGEDVSKSIIQDLINTERSNAFANTKGKHLNSNIILQGNYEYLGLAFHTLTNLGPNTLDNTEEESSTTKNNQHTSSSSKPAVQDKRENNLDKIENSDEDEYEFQTDSSLQASTATFVSNKVYKKPKEGRPNLKSTKDVGESVDEPLDYPPKLIVLHLRNQTDKAEAISTTLIPVSEDSWTSLPDKEIKNIKRNNEAVNDDEYDDTSDATYIFPTETLEATPKSRILKMYKNRLENGEKLSNHGFEAYSKAIKLQMTTLSETQPSDNEILPQTDKPLKKIAEDMEGKEYDKPVNETLSGQKLEENWIRKPTIFPNKKLKSSLKYAGPTFNIKKQEEDEQKEIETTRKEVERDQTFATYFVTLQNAKIMPDDTTTSSTQSTYSDNPRSHESLSRLESINDLGEEYYDEVAYNSQNGERVSKHVSNDKEMKSLGDKARVENGTVGQGKFDHYEDGINDVERSSYDHETIGYSTASDGLESSTSEETTMNDYELGISETESVTETPEHSQKKSVAKTAGKDKEFVRHLSSLISHLKQRRRKSQLESMDHRISRRARAVATSKPTPKPELRQARMSPAKEWGIGGGGIIIMGLLIIGMYRTVIKIAKKRRVWEKSTQENDFHAVLQRYEMEDETEDRLSDDVILLQSFIDQVMQKHEISEDGSIKEEYSTVEHLSRINAAITGTID